MCNTEHLSRLKLLCHLFAHSTSLLISSCNYIMASGFLALWQSLVSSANLDILLMILASWSFIYILEIVAGLMHHLVVHQMWLVLCCYRIGWFIPVGDDQLTSFGSIWLHHIECHVHWLLPLVFHVVPCQMLFETPDRQDLLLYCCPCHMCLWLG